MFMFTCKLHVQLSLPMLVIPLCRPWFPLLLLFPAERLSLPLCAWKKLQLCIFPPFNPLCSSKAPYRLVSGKTVSFENRSC